MCCHLPYANGMITACMLTQKLGYYLSITNHCNKGVELYVSPTLLPQKSSASRVTLFDVGDFDRVLAEYSIHFENSRLTGQPIPHPPEGVGKSSLQQYRSYLQKIHASPVAENLTSTPFELVSTEPSNNLVKKTKERIERITEKKWIQFLGPIRLLKEWMKLRILNSVRLLIRCFLKYCEHYYSIVSDGKSLSCVFAKISRAEMIVFAKIRQSERESY